MPPITGNVVRKLIKGAAEKVSGGAARAVGEARVGGLESFGQRFKTVIKTFGLGRAETNAFLEENYPTYVYLIKNRVLNLSREQGDYVMKRLQNIVGSAPDAIRDTKPALDLFRDMDLHLQFLGGNISQSLLKGENAFVAQAKDIRQYAKVFESKYFQMTPRQRQKLNALLEFVRETRTELIEKSPTTPIAKDENLLKNFPKLTLDDLEGFSGELQRITGNEALTWRDIYAKRNVIELSKDKWGREIEEPFIRVGKRTKFAIERGRTPQDYWEVSDDTLVNIYTGLWHARVLGEYDFLLNQMYNKYDLVRALSPTQLKEIMHTTKMSEFKRFEVNRLPKEIRDKLPEGEEALRWVTDIQAGGTQLPKQQIQALTFMAEGFDDKFLKQLGLTRRSYLIPESVALDLRENQKVLGDKTLRELSKLSKSAFLGWWKPMVTMYLGGIPFRLHNSFGDFTNLLIQDPGAFSKLFGASRLLWDFYIRGNTEAFNKFPKEFAKRIQQEGLFHTFFDDIGIDTVSNILRQTDKNSAHNVIFDALRTVNMGIKRMSDFAEVLPKVMNVMKNIERLEQGKVPVLGLAPKWVQKLLEEDPIGAIVSAGKEITVDYTAMPRQYRTLMTNLIAPFAYWYSRMFDKLIVRAVENRHLGALAAFTLPLIGAQLWNNQNPEFQAIEKGLTPHIKNQTHIILGKTAEGKAIVWSLALPTDQILDVLGLGDLRETFDKVITKEIKPSEFASRIISGIPVNVIRSALGKTNPFIQAAIGASTNKDPFTGRQIVPEKLVGTATGNAKLRQYLVNSTILGPVLPMLAASRERDLTELVKRADPVEWGQFLWESLKKPIDPQRAVGIYDFDPEQILASIAHEDLREANKQYEEFMRKSVDALKRGDKAEFSRRWAAALSGEETFVNLNLFLKFLARPSIQKELLRESGKKGTFQQQEKIKRLLNLLEVQQTLKQTPKDFRKQTVEDLEDFIRGVE